MIHETKVFLTVQKIFLLEGEIIIIKEHTV